MDPAASDRDGARLAGRKCISWGRRRMDSSPPRASGLLGLGRPVTPATERSRLSPIMRRLDKPAIMRRADQYLVHAHTRRHAGDEGDGAAAIFRLQHFGLLL